MAYIDLQNRIATDLTRPDLTSQIQNAIGDAIKFYERDRFWFNVTRSLTFQTVAGQTVYAAADLAQIPLIVTIDAMFITQAPGIIIPMDRYEPAEFEMLAGSTLTPGLADSFTYSDETISLWPEPNSVWTVRPHMHYKFPPLVQPTDTNSWCTDAEELIRTHAKLLLYTDVLEDPSGMQRMQVKLQPLMDKLNYETSARTATGKIVGTDF